MRTFSSIRAGIVIIGIGLCFTALTGRVAYLQTFGRQQTILRADREHYQSERLISRRGVIYDATGTLLAGTVQTRTLFIDPKFMQDRFQEKKRTLVQMDDAIAKLARLIDQKPYDLSKLLGERYDSRFVKVAADLDENTCKAIEAMDLPGVGLMPVNQRYYPAGSLAAHLLGYAGKEGIGLDGLEMRFEKLLAGKDGFKRTLKTFEGQGIAVAADDYVPPEHGRHLILTIDANIQMIAEQELAATCSKVKAKHGEVVVIDPQTGAILALANWPTFNPQTLDDSTPELRRNNCLVCPFEPGSAIKPFIAGPALAWNITRPEEMWPIPGISWNCYGSRRVTDVHGYGHLCTWDVLVKSSNIGMSMMGMRMGATNVRRALAGFEFGQATGVELPGEDPGLLPPLRLWKRDHVVSASQGYAIMVTPLQLARGFSAYANGGRLVQPRLVKGILDPEGNIESLASAPDLRSMPQVIDPVTAAQMKRILCDVTVRGTARGARSRTWNIFGKTGTAHISEGRAGYSATRFNSTFLGGAPAENPRLVIALVVHDPDRSIAHYGGTVSAPGAGKILERALSYLQVPASPDLPVPPPHIANVLFGYNANLYHNATASITAGD